MNKTKIMKLGDCGDEHVIGDSECQECWGREYPKKCEYCNKGLIHASFGDESYDGYWLYTRCDVCGESE